MTDRIVNYPKTVIFDLDDPLIVSIPAIRATLNYLLEEDGIAGLSIRAITKFFGFCAHWMVKKLQ